MKEATSRSTGLPELCGSRSGTLRSGSEPRFVLYAVNAEKGAALAAQVPTLVEPKPRTADDPRRLRVCLRTPRRAGRRW